MSSNAPPGKIPLEFIEKVSESFKRLRPHSGRPQSSDAGQPSTRYSDNLGSSTLTPGAYDGSLAWAGLVSALQALEQSADLCPPIKPMISKLLGCIPAIDQHTRGRKEYNELASNLRIMLIDLAKHLRESQSPQMRLCVANVISGIDEEFADINNKLARRGLSRVRSSEEDLEHLDACYKKIQVLSQQLQSNAALWTWSITEGLQMDQRLERMKPAVLAQYNAGISSEFHRRKCTHNTRQDILKELHSWAKDPNGVKIYWMNGMAGTGKTTIAYTLCAELDDQYKLGASFFCSRGIPGCQNVLNIVPTIAYRLARFSPPFRSALCHILSVDPDVVRYDVSAQFKRLVKEPLLQATATISTGMIVVVIDALDECTDPTTSRLLLDVLMGFAKDSPIKFFVTCRPDHGLLDKLTRLESTSRLMFHLHDIEKSIIRTDIVTYLREELSPIVSDEQIEKLANRAGELFIYAATIVRYILPKKVSIDPKKRLEVVLSAKPNHATKVDKQIDALYSAILSSALVNDDLEDEDLEAMRLVLRTVVCAKEPLTVDALARLLQLGSLEDAKRALDPLRSVLHVPENDQLVSVLHASFPDYILDPDRSGYKGFYFNPMEHSRVLVLKCFEIMKSSLRFNICKLESSFLLDEEVPDIHARIKENIPLHLLYACKHWGSHLCESSATNETTSALEDFLYNRVLFWLEVLNLTKCMDTILDQLPMIYQWSQMNFLATGISDLVQDAYRFAATTCASPVVGSTPHIYASILALWHKPSCIWEAYGSRLKGLINAKGEALSNRNPAALATWKVNQCPEEIAISSDGTRIACAGHENVLILDAKSGKPLLDPLVPPTHWVHSVSFSPDCSQIASGHDDGAVRIWDARSGGMLGDPLIWHHGAIRSVVFSPEGSCLVSGSADRTIILWDLDSYGILAGPFSGHIGGVRSVVFSPRGDYVTSGADDPDTIVRVWNVHDPYRQPIPLEGHSRGITSVAYSPTGGQIISGSDDGTVIVWNTENWRIAFHIFHGHNSSVRSVTFSPNGARFVSGSSDSYIRTWNSQTGEEAAAPVRAHITSVSSVLFSPDNSRIFSVSYSDEEVCLLATPVENYASHVVEAERGMVLCIDYLPCRGWVAASHDPGPIVVWDINSKAEVACLHRKGGWATSYCLSFSPDGNLLAFASEYNLIQMWNTNNTEELVNLFTMERINAIPHEHAIFLRFLFHGSCIGAVFHLSSVNIWDTQTGHLVSSFQIPYCGGLGPIIDIPENSSIVLLVSESIFAYIYDIHTGELTARSARPVQASSSTNTLEHAADEPGTSLFEEETNSLGFGDEIYAFAFSPDRRRVALSLRGDNKVLIRDLLTGAIIVDPFPVCSGSVCSLSFSLDAALIACGSLEGTVSVANSRDGSILYGPYKGHTQAVRSLVFLCQGYLASGSDDNNVRVWKLEENLRMSMALGHENNWIMGNDGWILSMNSERLLWVPLDLTPHLESPQSPDVFSRQGSFSIDFSGAFIGNQWGKCYWESVARSARRPTAWT
ncbi:Vegetative incompatibility protein HET-E-1 [Ceratobasidium sp. AG-Ba]|nr:Vegetative incompatibility protein HET-E-1 [Ceratobasidium sp. AG-Ba]